MRAWYGFAGLVSGVVLSGLVWLFAYPKSVPQPVPAVGMEQVRSAGVGRWETVEAPMTLIATGPDFIILGPEKLIARPDAPPPVLEVDQGHPIKYRSVQLTCWSDGRYQMLVNGVNGSHHADYMLECDIDFSVADSNEYAHTVFGYRKVEVGHGTPDRPMPFGIDEPDERPEVHQWIKGHWQLLKEQKYRAYFVGRCKRSN